MRHRASVHGAFALALFAALVRIGEADRDVFLRARRSDKPRDDTPAIFTGTQAQLTKRNVAVARLDAVAAFALDVEVPRAGGGPAGYPAHPHFDGHTVADRAIGQIAERKARHRPQHERRAGGRFKLLREAEERHRHGA